MKAAYKLLLLIAIMFLIGVLLKPSYSRFKEFSNGLNVKPYKIVTKKVSDYLVFAVFEKETYRMIDERDTEFDELITDYKLIKRERYKGYLLNFYEVGK